MTDQPQQPEFKRCKKCGKQPEIRLRKYSNMIYCPGHVSVLRSKFETALQAWNKANATEGSDEAL